MKESDIESVASNDNNAYDSALDDFDNEKKTSSDLLAKLKTELPLDDSKIDSEKLILPSPGKNTSPL